MMQVFLELDSVLKKAVFKAYVSLGCLTIIEYKKCRMKEKRKEREGRVER